MTFVCPEHGEFDIILESGQEAPIWCPIYKTGTTEPCGIKLKRIYSVPYIRFKGSGFFSTDNKK